MSILILCFMNDRGIILNIEDYKDNDKLLTCLLVKKGKCRILARGSRLLKSKLRGKLNFFSELEFYCAPGKRYNILTGVFVNYSFDKISNDLFILGITCQFLEIANSFLYPNIVSQNFYNLILDFLIYLNSRDYKINKYRDIILIYNVYLIKFLDLLGFRPYLDACVVCGCDINSSFIYFDYQRGGIICDRCYAPKFGSCRISKQSIDLLKILLNHADYYRNRQGLKSEICLNDVKLRIKELTFFARSLIKYHLERDLMSDKFLYSLKRNGI